LLFRILEDIFQLKCEMFSWSWESSISQYCFFIFLAVLGFELGLRLARQVLYDLRLCQPFFFGGGWVLAFFEIGSLELFTWGWL
jgi:hypothetical protein